MHSTHFLLSAAPDSETTASSLLTGLIVIDLASHLLAQAENVKILKGLSDR